jgi:hypothetical protein
MAWKKSIHIVFPYSFPDYRGVRGVILSIKFHLTIWKYWIKIFQVLESLKTEQSIWSPCYKQIMAGF